MAKNTNRRGWLGLYTCMVLCVAAAMGAVMLRYGRTLIWNPDGIKQPYTVFGYMGQAIRGLFTGGGWRMLSFSLGQGMDLLTTCTYYGYTDPFTLLGAFFSGNGIEIAYILSDFLRVYAAGICFGLYARKAGAEDGWATACAAAVYTGCGYFAWLIGRHPYFLNGALYLPLLLLGVERILQDRRWLLFTLTAGLELIVNFYFAYMNTVAAVLYIRVRLAVRRRRRGVKESAKDGFMLLGAYLLGAALSAFVFVPVAMVYIRNSRMGILAGYDGSMLHYDLKWYVELAASMFTPWLSPGNFLFSNFAPPALFALLALFGLRDARARQVRIALYLCLAAACVPMAGWVLNGTAYVSNRWSYILALFAVLGCALGFPAMLEREGRGRWVAPALGLVYAAGQAAYLLRTGQPKLLFAPAAVAGFAAVLAAYRYGWPKWLGRTCMRALTAAFLALCCTAYVATLYLPRGNNNISRQVGFGVYTRIASEGAGQLIGDEGVYRVAQGRYDDAQSLILGYMGTSHYWSLMDAENSEYYRKLALPTQRTSYHLYNFGGCAPMNAVAAVKYYIRQAGSHFVLPYGYEPAGTLALPNGSEAALYENALALPLGYAYDARLSTADYEALSVEDKLQVLTRYAIADEGNLPATAFQGGARELEYTVEAAENAELADNRLRGTDGGWVRLAFDAPEDGETYLLVENLSINNVSSMREGSLNVESALGRIESNVPHPNSNFYFPKDNFAFCLGSGALSSCEIQLGNRMDYSFDRIRVVSLPLSAYRESVVARRAEGMTDVALGRDSLTGKIAVSGDRVLQIAVPYSDGWRAWVDGEERPVFRCGGMYMGLEIGAGSHEIEMHYVTPGLKAGAIITLAGVALTTVLSILDRRRRRAA